MSKTVGKVAVCRGSDPGSCMQCVKSVGKVAVWRGGDLSAITPKLLQLEAANGRGWKGGSKGKGKDKRQEVRDQGEGHEG